MGALRDLTAIRSVLPRPDRAAAAGIVLAISGAALVLWLSRGMTFFSDEWAFIERRSLADLGTWLAPHNEHWWTLPVIAYRVLVETVGLTTYVPYVAAVLALHLLVVGLVHREVKRSAGGVVAVGATAILAFLGSGFENLYWGFQTGFVGATAAGLAALSVIGGPATRTRAISAATLLTIGLMSAGVALVFLAAVGLEVLLKPTWRRWLPLFAVPVVVYSAWFVSIGRAGIGAVREPTLSTVLRVPEFVAQGFGNALGSILGIGPQVGLIAAAVVIAGGVTAWRGRVPVRALAAGVAIALLYALIAVSRAGVMEGQVHYTRYTYVGVVLAFVGLAALFGPVVLEAWRGRPRLRPWLAGAAALALVLSLAWNIRLLVGGREVFLDRAAFTRALIIVALREPLPPGVDPERSLVYVPSPASLRRLVSAHGSPLDDVLMSDAVATPEAPVFDRAEKQLRDPKVPLPENVE